MDMDLVAVGNMVAATGWLALLLGLFVARARKPAFLYGGFILPLVLALAYAVLLGRAMTAPAGGPAMDFSSLEGVKALFSQDAGVTIGWYHYLAFDLFVGAFVARDGLSRGVWPLLLVPFLALTFMFGPTGLLAYAILWAVFLRNRGQGVPAPVP